MTSFSFCSFTQISKSSELTHLDQFKYEYFWLENDLRYERVRLINGKGFSQLTLECNEFNIIIMEKTLTAHIGWCWTLNFRKYLNLRNGSKLNTFFSRCQT